MLIAGNWKMNTNPADAADLARAVAKGVESDKIHVAVCPPFLSLVPVAEALKGSNVSLGAQNMHFEDKGAFTGEVSASMLKAAGCTYVILGHSERRQYFGETDEGVNKKVQKALSAGLIPIVCVGETLEERESDQVERVVRRQVEGGLKGVKIDGPDALVVAYEPVWAIGTGRTASAEQAQEVHAFIRGLLTQIFGETTGKGIDILYGGSMKGSNADELLSQPDVNGGLIGGAALKADEFLQIVAAGEKA